MTNNPLGKKILWLTWKDRGHPEAGGAEIVNEALAKRLVRDKHEVIFLTTTFPGAKQEEVVNGYKIIRLGNRWTVYWQAYRYYKQHLVGWAELVIDEVNTIPFFCKFYVKEKNIVFIHQLAREIWFYRMFFPLNLIGYLLEPIYLWSLRDRTVITVSDSTRNDLIRYGFQASKIFIISEGIELKPIADLRSTPKYATPTVLSLGALREMKRTDHIIKAFELAKSDLPNLRLLVAGSSDSKYGKKVLQRIKTSKYADSIHYLGKVSEEKKIELLQKAHVICVTSVKEGWGLIVTEANSQGTPAVVYNVSGLRDSVKPNKTGSVCSHNTPQNLASSMVNLLNQPKMYREQCQAAWQWSKELTFDKSYNGFMAALENV